MIPVSLADTVTVPIKPVLENRPSLIHKSIEKKVNSNNGLILRSYLNLKICLRIVRI